MPALETSPANKEEPVIELLGLFYGITKDIKDYLTFDEEAEVVDSDGPGRSRVNLTRYHGGSPCGYKM